MQRLSPHPLRPAHPSDTHRSNTHRSKLNRTPLRPSAALTLLLLGLIPVTLHAGPTLAAFQVFAAYTTAVEHRLAQQHASPTTFLADQNPTNTARLHHGEILLEHLTEPNTSTPPTATDTLLHHWRGTAFVPGAHAAAFEHLLRDLPAYPEHFAPEVLRATVLTTDHNGDHLQTALRLRQHHGITVTLDTTYDITFGHPDPHHGFSASRSVRITEVANPNTPTEHPLSPADEYGFLLRLNTYWTWEERPDGLVLQIETISLSRAIPTGLGWALRPYVESIPRDSLTFTLTSARNALTAVSP